MLNSTTSSDTRRNSKLSKGVRRFRQLWYSGLKVSAIYENRSPSHLTSSYSPRSSLCPWYLWISFFQVAEPLWPGVPQSVSSCACLSCIWQSSTCQDRAFVSRCALPWTSLSKHFRPRSTSDSTLVGASCASVSSVPYIPAAPVGRHGSPLFAPQYGNRKKIKWLFGSVGVHVRMSWVTSYFILY